MRLLIVGIGTLFILLTGCGVVKNVSTLMAFIDDPLVNASERGGTRQDILAIEQPKRITSIRGGTAECFDYRLKKSAQKTDFFVAFTSTGKVNANGFTTCAQALAAGRLNSNELPRKK
jgi:osmotically inducible lipoprotein OsmE